MLDLSCPELRIKFKSHLLSEVSPDCLPKEALLSPHLSAWHLSCHTTYSLAGVVYDPLGGAFTRGSSLGHYHVPNA